MSLSPDDVLKAARLARLALDADEVGEVAARLNRVLDLFEQMRSVDTEGIEPMAHALEGSEAGFAAARQRLRPDAVVAHDSREALQAVAPAVDAGLYLVPRVLE
jgi:aspartyl-tRNA(Asn)/glutamyl-tRNA(Gln) amidotransferase subunit C